MRSHLRGQLVDLRRRGRIEPVLRYETRALELLQPGRQDVGADARKAGGEVRVALRAGRQIAEDGQDPALTDQVEAAKRWIESRAEELRLAV